MTLKLLAAVAASAFAGVALADSQFSLSEIFVNPPGTDNTQEGIEIRGPASTTMAGYHLIVIEGDGTAAGVVDYNLDLSTKSTGSNGLFLWRDAAITISPAPDAGTSVFVQDFNPDLENGTYTWILGYGSVTPSVGTLLDADHDGTLDAGVFASGGALDGFTVVDCVSMVENDGPVNFSYADDVGYANAVIGPFLGVPGISDHNPDCLVRIYNANGPCGWAGGDVLGTNPGGPYSFDYTASPPRVFGFADFGITTSQAVTLGSANPSGVDSDNDGVLDHCDGCPSDPNKGAAGSCGCGVAEGCTLGIDVDAISATTGGAQVLSLHGGLSHAGYGYLVLGSATGTVPGLQVSGSVHLDLNPDFYFNLLATYPNTIVFPSLGNLDAAGEATATWFLPGGAVTLGSPITVTHAYLLFDPVTTAIKFASNTTPLTINP